ncbi:MAG TPA: phosphotransferase [Nevskiaceae bacterium]|nr:phosphotransferase [Nevskiaceae bacterium]
MTLTVEHIQAAFAKDEQRKGRKLTTTQDLPLRYEDLTVEWLTDALCSRHRGAAVTSFELLTPDSGSSNRCRIRLAYNEAGRAAGLPPAVFCKATQGLANRVVLGISQGSYIEALFYNEIRPHLDIEAPVSWFAKFDPETFNSIIMLTDLTDSVTSFCSHQTEMTRARVESEVRLLATLHGQSYRKPELEAALAKVPTWPEYFINTHKFGIEQGSNNGFLAAKEVLPTRLYQRYPEIWPATMASVMRHDQLPLAFAHGDVHLKNWYIAGNGEMGLGDWQCASRGHWSRDLCYAIATALTVENRRAWEKELIALFLDELARHGGAVMDFETAHKHYREQLLTALTWWTITLSPAPDMPDMQPRDITLEFIRRIGTAMDDLDALDVW